MMEHRPSNNDNRRLDRAESFSDEDSDLLAFAQDLEGFLSPVPAREERRARANRSAFLTAAAGQFTRPRSRWAGWWRRLRLQGATLLLVFTASWLSVRVASASSLPGDTLYPVKLTMEQVDQLFYGEERWEAQVQNRRLTEVLTLVQSGRAAEVEFQGSLQQGADGGWRIDGIPMHFEPEAQGLMQRVCGPVKVQGFVTNGQFLMLYLTPSCLSLDAPEQPSRVPIPTPLIMPGQDGTPSGEPIIRHPIL